MLSSHVKRSPLRILWLQNKINCTFSKKKKIYMKWFGISMVHYIRNRPWPDTKFSLSYPNIIIMWKWTNQHNKSMEQRKTLSPDRIQTYDPQTLGGHSIHLNYGELMESQRSYTSFKFDTFIVPTNIALDQSQGCALHCPVAPGA